MKARMTTATMIKDLKVGDALPNTPKNRFGQLINNRVHSIEHSKSGRIKITMIGQYQHAEDGKIDAEGIWDFSNGPLSINTPLSYRF